MSEQVTTGQGFIELEAAPYLEEGQNFYDQPPFSDVLENTSKLTDRELSTEMQNGESLIIGTIIYKWVKNERGKVRMAVHKLGQALSSYPYWNEYILTQSQTYNSRLEVINIG